MTEFRESIDSAFATLGRQSGLLSRADPAALTAAGRGLDASGYLAHPPTGDAAAFRAAADVAWAGARHMPELAVGDCVLVTPWVAADSGVDAFADVVEFISGDVRVDNVAGRCVLNGVIRGAFARSGPTRLATIATWDASPCLVSFTSPPPLRAGGQVRLTDAAPVEMAVPDGAVVRRIRLRQCLAAAVMTAGALSSALELTVRYVNTREQFGRPISAFQAVKQQLAGLAAEQRACQAAADGVIAAVAADLAIASRYTEMAILSARVRAAQAATAVSGAAHQLHGAIGLTLEYPLHRFTTAAREWRDSGIGEGQATADLGRLAAIDAGSFWSLIIRSSVETEEVDP